jgi:anthranilate phosphoribosyltransferase
MYLTDNLARILPDPSAAADPDAALARLYCGESLNEAEAEALFGALVEGRLPEPSIAAMLIALRLKGETAEELIGAARALRAADAPFERPATLFADSCGTGGDGSGTINVSTAVAFVAAAAGLPVAKHGNRSVTSRCGSADVLEQLVRTIMNVLGPCVNPAEPPVQLLGVADPKLLEPVARTLAALGVREALVVHGSGLDEVALHGPTSAVRLSEGATERVSITPEDAGLTRAPVEALRGGGPEENAARLKSLLLGYGTVSERQVVALNAGALLMTARLVADLKDGVERASEVLASGAAYRVLRDLAEITNG